MKTRIPERVETTRLLMERPSIEDAPAIFERYASDAEVTRLLSWPRHQSVDVTRAFVEFSEAEWRQWSVGPYLIRSRLDGRLLGGTGLAREAPDCASTGYVLAKDAWGRGYATEALGAMVDVARAAGFTRLYALCHPQNAASARVLEKSGFVREGTWPRHAEFPNFQPGVLSDVHCYSISLVQRVAGNG
jgi:RimJ/RimL family protein N-acetyltransferase